jgi:methionyl-tRNA formyltransferase
LHDTLSILGAQAMVDVLAAPLHPGFAQPSEGVIYAKKIDKAEARIDFSKPAHEVLRHIHGLSPFPGAWTVVSGARVKILRCAVVDTSRPAGRFVDDALTIACGEKSIRCLELQREGKGAMSAQDFLRGFPVAAGMDVG